jgi:hypothetical protein
VHCLIEVSEGFDIMQSTTHTFPVHVRTGWIDFSPALHWYATRRVKAALRPVAPCIRSVSVRFADPELRDVGSRECTIDVALKSNGAVSTTVAGADLYEVVDRAATAVLTKLKDRRAAGAAVEPLSQIA